MTQQQDENRTLLREVKRMKEEFQRSQETMPTVVHPRILNFDNVGPSGNHQENTAPATTVSLWGKTMKNQAFRLNNLNEPFNTPRNLDSSNFLNRRTINTNSTNVDAGIGLNMAREL